MRITRRYYRLSRKRSLCIFVTYLILNHKDTPKSWATRLDKTSYLDQNVSQTYQTKIFKTGRLWSFWLEKPEDFTLYSEIAKYQKKKINKIKLKKKKKNGPQAISSLLESIISPIDVLLGTSNLFTS